MSRLVNQIQPGLGLPAAVLFPFFVSLGIVIFEKIKFKRAIFSSPYFLFVCCWMIEIIILISLPNTEFWKDLVINTFSNQI